MLSRCSSCKSSVKNLHAAGAWDYKASASTLKRAVSYWGDFLYQNRMADGFPAWTCVRWIVTLAKPHCWWSKVDMTCGSWPSGRLCEKPWPLKALWVQIKQVGNFLPALPPPSPDLLTNAYVAVCGKHPGRHSPLPCNIYMMFSASCGIFPECWAVCLVWRDWQLMQLEYKNIFIELSKLLLVYLNSIWRKCLSGP